MARPHQHVNLDDESQHRGNKWTRIYVWAVAGILGLPILLLLLPMVVFFVQMLWMKSNRAEANEWKERSERGRMKNSRSLLLLPLLPHFLWPHPRRRTHRY